MGYDWGEGDGKGVIGEVSKKEGVIRKIKVCSNVR